MGDVAHPGLGKVRGKSVKFIDGLWHLCAAKQGYSVIHLQLAGREGWRERRVAQCASLGLGPQTWVLFLIKL